MKILAVEFSSELRSVAIVAGSAADSSLLGQASEQGGRNARAFALIEDVLQQAQIEREDIDCIAVGLGPGSYAGIRASIALAQGWQLARDIKLIGISSVECLAAQAQKEGMRGGVNIIVDAQRREFYLGEYDLAENGYSERKPLRIVSFTEVENRISERQPVIGPDSAQSLPGAKDLYADAATLGRLALSKTDFVSGEKLEPIYLREVSFVKAPIVSR